MTDKFIVPPLDVLAEVTACLNAGMAPSELLQILCVLRKAVSEGNNRFNISWAKEAPDAKGLPQ